MKKIVSILTLALVFLATGCTKEKKCACTSDKLDAHNNPVVTYIHVKNGLSCSKITSIGWEHQSEGALVRDLDAVVCEEVKD